MDTGGQGSRRGWEVERVTRKHTLPYVKQTDNANLLYASELKPGSVTTWRVRVGRQVGGRFKWEGTWVNLWLIHVW